MDSPHILIRPIYILLNMRTAGKTHPVKKFMQDSLAWNANEDEDEGPPYYENGETGVEPWTARLVGHGHGVVLLFVAGVGR